MVATRRQRALQQTDETAQEEQAQSTHGHVPEEPTPVSSVKKPVAFTAGMDDGDEPPAEPTPVSSVKKPVAFTAGMDDGDEPPAEPTPVSSVKKPVAFTAGMDDGDEPPAEPTPVSSVKKPVAFTAGMDDGDEPPAEPTPVSSVKKPVAFTAGMDDGDEPPAEPTPVSSVKKPVAFTAGMDDGDEPPAEPTPVSSVKKPLAFTAGMDDGDEPPAEPTPVSSVKKPVAFTAGMDDGDEPPAEPTPVSSVKKPVAFTAGMDDGDDSAVQEEERPQQHEQTTSSPLEHKDRSEVSPSTSEMNEDDKAMPTTPQATLPPPVEEIEVHSHRVELDPDEDGAYPDEDKDETFSSPIKQFIPRGKQGKTFMERRIEAQVQERGELSIAPKMSKLEIDRALFIAEKVPRKAPSDKQNHENIFGDSLERSLTSRMSKLEIAQRDAAKNMPRPKSAKPSIFRTSHESTEESLSNVLVVHKSGLEQVVEAAKRDDSRGQKRSPKPKSKADIFGGTFLSSLPTHMSKLEQDVAVAKAASAGDQRSQHTMRPHSAKVQHATEWGGNGMDLTIRKSRLEIEKEQAIAANASAKKRSPRATTRISAVDLGDWGAGLAEVSVRHKSALERMKENAKELPRTPPRTPGAQPGSGAGNLDWGLVRPKSALERMKENTNRMDYSKKKKLSPNSRMMAEWEQHLEPLGSQPIRKTDLEREKEAWQRAAVENAQPNRGRGGNLFRRGL